jgi:hypothetical protein
VVRYRVELSSRARKFYATCSKELARDLDSCFEDLENNPYSGPRIKRLKPGRRNGFIGTGWAITG